MIEITDEMRRAAAAKECRQLGHDFDEVVEMATGDPVRLLCARCDRSWHVSGAGIGGQVEIAAGGHVYVLVDRDVEDYPPAGTRVELVAVDRADFRAPAGDQPLDR